MVEREVLRAALLAYLEGLRPKERRAFVERLSRHLGVSTVIPIRKGFASPEATDWLAENFADLLGRI